MRVYIPDGPAGAGRLLQAGEEDGMGRIKGVVVKTCGRCGRTAPVPAWARRCRERKFGRGSYCCWGRLARVVEAKPKKEVAMKAPKAKARPQDLAQKKLDHARRMVSEKTKAINRLATALRAWERKATYYAKRASMTDAELAAETAARHAKAAARKPKRRAIALPKAEVAS